MGEVLVEVLEAFPEVGQAEALDASFLEAHLEAHQVAQVERLLMVGASSSLEEPQEVVLEVILEAYQQVLQEGVLVVLPGVILEEVQASWGPQ